MVNNHYTNRILRKANKWLIYLTLTLLPLKSKQPAHHSPSFQLGNKVWNERTLTKNIQDLSKFCSNFPLSGFLRSSQH